MTSAGKISRWLEKPIDPVAIEDWMANRELLNDQNHRNIEIENAWELEQRVADKSREEIVDEAEILLVRPKSSGKFQLNQVVAEVKITRGKVEYKFNLHPGEFLPFRNPSLEQLKVYVSLQQSFRIMGKNSWKWEGIGKKWIIVDGET